MGDPPPSAESTINSTQLRGGGGHSSGRSRLSASRAATQLSPHKVSADTLINDIYRIKEYLNLR